MARNYKTEIKGIPKGIQGKTLSEKDTSFPDDTFTEKEPSTASTVETQKTRLRILHVGRSVPKELRALGYKETGAIHLGHGAWLISCERAP